MVIKNSTQRILTGLLLAGLFYTLFFYCPPIFLSATLFFTMLIMITELKKIVPHEKRFFTFASLYPIFPCLILIYFNETPAYKNLLLYLFIIVFSFDTCSYFCGKLYSKFWTPTKIVPKISPGKSWQGAIGGYLLTTLIVLKITDTNILLTLFLSAIICTIAFLGDIFESYLKRSANLKDSGNILPGHGGLLDRFDAVLAVSYFFFIFKDYLIHFLR